MGCVVYSVLARWPPMVIGVETNRRKSHSQSGLHSYRPGLKRDESGRGTGKYTVTVGPFVPFHAARSLICVGTP